MKRLFSKTVFSVSHPRSAALYKLAPSLPGTKFLFQVAIQILYHNHGQLMLVQDDGEAMSLLNEFTENISNKDSPFQAVSGAENGLPKVSVVGLGVQY